jgi:hypothetical protein
MATEKQLRETAKEFNEVMDGLDPLIDHTLPIDELTPVLKEAIGWIDPKTDHFTEETQAVIDELSGKPTKKSPAQKKAEELHEKNIGKAPIRTSAEPEEEEEPLTPSGRKQVPIPVKEKKAPVKEKATKPAGEKKQLFASKSSTMADRVAFLTPLIEKGKLTKTQLVEKAHEKFPDLAISSLQTMLTDAKNPRYNRFAKLIQEDENHVLTFKG